MKRCPECGCEVFYVNAHVTQDWKVDCNGDYLETLDECIEVVRLPDDNDLWECADCGHSDVGANFNVKLN